ncbi:GNAT family N-acetyltransferase [Kiloniella antarctica]|uniref:GNAT family N-acetyltransferase n=1 Tax=Kiloniella antarctica TaxID=1550907 RepID=A0ABW5BDB9_9PROT
MFIKTAVTTDDFNQARSLFKTYESWAEVCPCFEGFERELLELTERYSLPQGQLWLAFDDREPEIAIAVVGVRIVDNQTCELKRLWVDPKGRGQKVGGALLVNVIEFARNLGVSSLTLETVPGIMDTAIDLYLRFGFSPKKEPANKSTLEMTYAL